MSAPLVVKGRCTTCDKDQPLKPDGRVHVHQVPFLGAYPGRWIECPGSRLAPTETETLR